MKKLINITKEIYVNDTDARLCDVECWNFEDCGDTAKCHWKDIKELQRLNIDFFNFYYRHKQCLEAEIK